MDALAEKKVASVTRVMPDPHKDIGLNILSQFHYGAKVKIATFETLADALQDIATKVNFPVGLILRGFVPCLNRFGFSHVLAFFCGPVEAGALLVINMAIGINPNQAVTSAGRGRFRRCLSARAFRGWGCGRSRRTGCCRRRLWFEHIAQTEFW